MNNNYVLLPSKKGWYSLKDLKGEIWRDVCGYEGLYLVSNFGRVKTVSHIKKDTNYTIPTKIKRQNDNGKGYLMVGLSKDGKDTKYYVHRLVASSFIPNPFNFKTVNHKDENKKNNKVENLEWCSYKYNNNYGTARYRFKKTIRENGNTTHIDMYDLNGQLLKHYECAYDIEKDGLSRREVYNVCNNRLRSYKGCVFRFSGHPFSYRSIDKHPKGEKKEVIKTDINGNIISVYNSISEAEKKNDLKRNYLYSATYASTRKAFVGGFYFEIKKYNQ